MDSTAVQDGSLSEASSQSPLRVQRHSRTVANPLLIHVQTPSCCPLHCSRSMLPVGLELRLLIILRKKILPHNPLSPLNPTEREPYPQILFTVPENPPFVIPVLP